MELSRLVVSLEVVGRIGDEVIFRTAFPAGNAGAGAPQGAISGITKSVVPSENAGANDVQLADYVMPIGKHKGKTFGQIGKKALGDWAEFMSGLSDLKGKGLEALNAAKRYLS